MHKRVSATYFIKQNYKHLSHISVSVFSHTQTSNKKIIMITIIVFTNEMDKECLSFESLRNLTYNSIDYTHPSSHTRLMYNSRVYFYELKYDNLHYAVNVN